MANEGINAAIKELQEKLGAQMQSVVDTKKAINLLCTMINEPPLFTDIEGDEATGGSAISRIREDQFFRKSITTAAKEYLQMKGSAAPVQEIIDALTRGGCDLGTSALRNVKISLSKNSGTFASVRDDVFGLWEFYGGKPRINKKLEETISANGNEEPEILTEENVKDQSPDTEK